MLLRFTNHAALTSALATGAIPPEVASQPIEWAQSPDGAVIVDTPHAFPQASLEKLALLKVKGSVRSRNKSLSWRPVTCWLQAIPLERDRDQEITSQTPVLFETPSLDEAAEIARELLRLGNDRQGLLSIESPTATDSAKNGSVVRYLLRALGPSYYTLLRTTEASRSVRGFVERHPRIFVEAGWSHPLSDRMVAPPGEQWLLARDHQWQRLPETPFQDLYEVAQFTLPAGPADLSPREAGRFTVPIHLAASGTEQPAEMWVLRRDALEQVQQWVETAADDVVARLSFAVVEGSGETGPDASPWIVLRVRPSQQAPPTLVFDALALAPVQRLSNILAPVGKRIFPPIRRDAIQKLLHPGDGQTVWLENDAAGVLRRFSVADAAFRPLTELVAYTIDSAASVLKEWYESTTFDFSAYVCREDRQSGNDRRSATAKATETAPTPPPVVGKPVLPRDVIDEMVMGYPAKPAKPPTEDELAAVREQARQLELSFVTDPASLDAPHRAAIWPQLAGLQQTLRRYREAILCHLHCVWEDPTSAAVATARWSALVRQASGKGGKTGLVDDRGLTTAAQLDETLSLQKPSPLQVEQLAAWLSSQAALHGQGAIADSLVTERIGRIMAFLEKWDRLISVRGAWLAQMAMAQFSGGDSLLVAQARDRILERIFSRGIDPDIEMPSFLSDAKGGERLAELRVHVSDLCEVVQEWSVKNLRQESRATSAYIDFAFSFVLAKLGESDQARNLWERAERALVAQQEGTVHQWLSRAFGLRIRQALERRETGGTLPEAMLAELPSMDSNSRYKVDKVRDRSRILQPIERLYAYRHIAMPAAWSDVVKKAESLIDTTSQQELLKECEALVKEIMPDDDGCRVLAKLLELAPRLGERFFLQILPRLGKAVDGPGAAASRIAVAEKAIVAAGHFGHVEFAREMAAKLGRLLDKLRDSHSVDAKTLEALAAMTVPWFQNLRRLGLHRDLADVLPKLNALVPTDNNQSLPKSLEGLKLVLAVAAVDVSLGRGNSNDGLAQEQGKRARETLSLVRGLLAKRPFETDGTGHVASMKQCQLACAYVAAIGMLPIDELMASLNDLFGFVTGVADNSSLAYVLAMKQFEIVDTLATTLLADDIQRDDASRRWLEEEEFLIRRRIHHDLRTAEAKASH